MCGTTRDFETLEPVTDASWLTVPDLVEILQLSPSRIRRLMEEHVLPAVRRDGVLQVPAAFVVDGAPQPELRGTMTLLLDAGFREDEAIDWLLAEHDAMGTSPIAALTAGRKAEVRRVAQASG